MSSSTEEVLAALSQGKALSFEDWKRLIAGWKHPELREQAVQLSRQVTDAGFGNAIWFRGIIEFSNYCTCRCRYCGISASVKGLTRYRLSEEEILAACEQGYTQGIRTFVLQSGEDPLLTDDWLCACIHRLLSRFPDVRITLSVGIRSEESYRHLFAAGASRYLLRHETADPQHFRFLHPEQQDFWQRMTALYTLRAIGFQTGCGMMIGSPGQGIDQLAADMCFIQNLQPQMIGIGPFLPHHATPFAHEPAGSTDLTLYMLSLCRLLLPDVLLPATTALRASSSQGLTQAVRAGCNVVMPNITPAPARPNYLLYDAKPLAENMTALREELEAAGYELKSGVGDHPAFYEKPAYV